jgi:uncharacterized membrane protein
MTEPSPVGPVHTETSTGLAANVGGALAYLLGPITGILFLVLEKKSSYVRFHAAQSIVLWVSLFVLAVALSIVMGALTAIPVLGWIIGMIWFLFSLVLAVGGLVLWLFLMYKGYKGEEWEFPWVGRQARNLLLK